jgi:hypothetical protein
MSSGASQLPPPSLEMGQSAWGRRKDANRAYIPRWCVLMFALGGGWLVVDVFLDYFPPNRVEFLTPTDWMADAPQKAQPRSVPVQTTCRRPAKTDLPNVLPNAFLWGIAAEKRRPRSDGVCNISLYLTQQKTGRHGVISLTGNLFDKRVEMRMTQGDGWKVSTSLKHEVGSGIPHTPQSEKLTDVFA